MEEEDHYELTHRLIEGSKLKRPTCVIISLIITICVAVAIILALSVTIGVTNTVNGNNPTPPPKNDSNTTVDEVCLTASCVDLASFARQTMDESVDPCDDFYKFACGGWEQNNIVQPGMLTNDMATQLVNRNAIALKKALENEKHDGVEAVKKVVDMYKSCINTSVIDSAGVQPLLDLIDLSGGWSLLNGNDSGWNINGDDFVTEVYLGSTAFLRMDVNIDTQNSSRFILLIQQSGISIQSVDPKSLNEFRDKIVTTLSSLNVSNVSHDMLQHAADGIVDFETKLVQILDDVSKVDVADVVPITLGELANISTNFQWLNFTKALFGRVNVTVDAKEPVLVPTLNYFRNLSHLIESAGPGVLENYAKWHLIKGYLDKVTMKPSPLPKPLYTQTQGSSIISDIPFESLAVAGAGDRYKTCIADAQSALPLALARVFAKHILAPNTKGNVSVMVKYIKGAFKERLDGNTWLDAPTKQLCKEKVDAVTEFISYPEQLFNDTYLNEMYFKFKISPDDYFGNYKQSVLLNNQLKFKPLHDKVDKAKFMWTNPPTQVNAFYSPQVNSLIILEAISRVPWFDPDWPDYFKYGALGAVVAHELTHGFDNNGRNYDKYGNHKMWWTNASIEAFEERQKCFVNQYSDYEMFGYHIDGNLTLPDNIADNGGLKVGFQAYKDFVAQNPDVKKKMLPILNKYTSEQLYFIGWAQLWCSVFTETGFAAVVKTDHSPGPFRVTGTVVNSPEFASTFNCRDGSKMNPPLEKKCLMW